jgi:hypothetical protein
MAPSSMAIGQPRPKRCAVTATSPAVATTPIVASTAAGASTSRADDDGVFNPPSKRINTSAVVPTRKAKP